MESEINTKLKIIAKNWWMEWSYFDFQEGWNLRKIPLYCEKKGKLKIRSEKWKK